MANLQKLTYTEWYDVAGRRVKPGTPGAVKRQRESAKWYAYWREGKRQHKVPLCTDKAAAQAMLADLMRTRDRVKARIVDPRQRHYDRPLKDHLGEYLPVMRAKGKSGHDKDRKEAILRAFAAGVRTLPELTHEAVDG